MGGGKRESSNILNHQVPLILTFLGRQGKGDKNEWGGKKRIQERKVESLSVFAKRDCFGIIGKQA